MATGNIIIGPNNNTGLYVGQGANTTISGGGGGGTGNYSNANVASYLQVLTSNISTTGNITAYRFFGNNVSTTGNITAPIFLQTQPVVRLGTVGGTQATSTDTVSLGRNAGGYNQQANAIAIGSYAGNSSQGANAIAIGRSAGQTSQSHEAIAIGRAAGLSGQGANAVAMGYGAAQNNQGANSVALGYGSANTNQGIDSLAIMRGAGYTYQGNSSIAIGVAAASNYQGANAIAIGRGTGNNNQGANSVAIGYNAAFVNQGANSVAIGRNAGNSNQGANSIAIGALAGFSVQPPKSIILNASGNILNGSYSGLYVNPVRNDATNTAQVMFFNTGTKEVTYAPQSAITAGYSNANVQSFMPVFAGDMGNVVAMSAQMVEVSDTITANCFEGDGGCLSNINGANIVNGYDNTSVETYLPYYNGPLNPSTLTASGNVVTGNILIAGSGTVTGDFNVLGNLTYTGVNSITTSNLYINLANNQSTYANIDNAGIVVGNTSSPLTQFQYKVGGNTWYTNVGISATGNLYSGNISSTGSITGVGNLRINAISASGNVGAGYVSATGNIRGANFVTDGNIYANGTIGGNLLLNSSNIVRLGQGAGNATSNANVIAIGRNAAQINQGDAAIAIGFQAGNNNQGGNAIAIGRNAGYTGPQGANAIAIGRSSGNVNQGYQAIALGHGAGNLNQGIGAIAIGRGAGYIDQPANSIIITASGNMTGTNQGLYINPIRNDLSAVGNVVFFDPVTSEITYADAGIVSGNYSNANVQGYLDTFDGNINAQQIASNTQVNLASSNYVQLQYDPSRQYDAGNITSGSWAYIGADGFHFESNVTGTYNTVVLDNEGNISAVGNIIGSYLYGDGSNITNIPGANYSNSNVQSYLQVLTSNISTTGNVTANQTNANIVGLGANFSITSYDTQININSDANIANSTTGLQVGQTYLAAYATNFINLQTGLGGNAVSWQFNDDASLTAPGSISAVGNIQGNYILGNGAYLTGLPASYGNSNVAAYLQVLTTNVSTTGNVYGGNFVSSNIVGDGVNAVTITANNSNVGDIHLNASNIRIGKNNTTAILATRGTGNLVVTTNEGSNTESNITIVNGAGGNIQLNPNDGGIVTVSKGLSAVGNISTGNYFIGNGAFLTGLPASYSNANVASYLPVYNGNILANNISVTGNVYSPQIVSSNVMVYGNSIITGNLTVQGTTTTINSNIIVVNDRSITLANNISNVSLLQGSGIEAGNSAGNPLVSFVYDVGTTSWQSNVGITPAGNNVSNLGGTSNYWNNVYSNTIINSGNITAGNISTVGNVIGGYLYGDGSNITGIVGDYSNSNVESFLQVLTSDISTTGNVYAGNINVSNVSSIRETVAGSADMVEFTANVEYNTNTLQLSNPSVAPYADSLLYAGNNVKLVSDSANAGYTFNFSDTGEFLAPGNISTTGNVTANSIAIGSGAVIANVGVGYTQITSNITDPNATAIQLVDNDTALVSAVTNIYFQTSSGISNYSWSFNNQGDTSAPGNISAVGNIIGSYLYGDGSNITGLPATYSNTDVDIHLADFGSNVISTTGNITAGYFIGDGSQLTGLPASYGNANVAAYLPTYTGNIAGNNISITGNITTTNKLIQLYEGNVITSGVGIKAGTGSEFQTASFIYDSSLPGWSSSAIAPVSDAAYNLGKSSHRWNNFYTINVNTANVVATGYISATGNITAGNISASGTITGGNIVTVGLVSATGNVSGNYILGNGALLTGIAGSYGNANVAAYLPTYTGNLGNTGNSVSVQLVNYKDVVYTGGNATGTITPDASNGSIYKYTLTGNITLNAFGGTPQAGQHIILVLTQDATGNRLLTSTMKWAGGFKTLSTTANAVDIATIWYDGSTYYGALTRGYS